MWTEESALLSAKEVIKDFSRPDDYLKVRMTTKKQAQCLYLEGGHFLQALIIAEVQKTIKLLWAKTELLGQRRKGGICSVLLHLSATNKFPLYPLYIWHI
jgi:hypothetical protein